ncbi:unnamed protein product [Acidithrix sp. C25]|nr:unnamed protein product [Acidithrix sp. C25]
MLILTPTSVTCSVKFRILRISSQLDSTSHPTLGGVIVDSIDECDLNH